MSIGFSVVLLARLRSLHLPNSHQPVDKSFRDMRLAKLNVGLGLSSHSSRSTTGWQIMDESYDTDWLFHPGIYLCSPELID